MQPTDEPRETYWDLLADVARLQAEMGKDLAAWARAYQAGGEAFQQSAETLSRMADVGRRMERYMQQGPPLAVRQALQLFTAPWQMPGGSGSPAMPNPLAPMWEAWSAAFTGSQPPTPPERSEPEGTARG